MQSLFCVLAAAVCFTATSPQVQGQASPTVLTENGPVVGRFRVSHSGKEFTSFEGIPYARPPVGDLRFQEPQPLEKKWIGKWNATSPGSACLQLDQFTPDKDEYGNKKYAVLGDENCLFLNVYFSNTGKKNRNVIFFIHGGGFTFGKGNLYRPDYIMDRETEDIVFVSFNYRLGPLGFLSTGDSLVPGNNGLKDQALALAWVQRNIAAFGGDPKKVTIAGLSAGGASTHFHFFSPLSKGLFNRGYSYSGTALCPWALIHDGPQKTLQLASLLGCPTTDSRTMIKCLKKRPAHQIVSQTVNFLKYVFNPFTIFGPVVEVGAEKPFIDQHPRELLKQGLVEDLPWVLGVNTEEGLYPAGEFIPNENLLEILNNDWEKLGEHLFYFDSEIPVERRVEATNKIRKQYLGDKDISPETITPFVQMLGDRLFVAPSAEAAELQAQANSQPVYLYHFGYSGSTSISKFITNSDKAYGVCHGDDMSYVVKFGDMDTHISKSDKDMADVLLDMFLTFVTKGKVPKDLNWEPVPKVSGQPVKYLKILSPEDINVKACTNFGNVNTLSDLLSQTIAKDEL